MSLFDRSPQPLSAQTLATLDAKLLWWATASVLAAPRGWAGKVARVEWGTAGHEREWVVNIDGFGPLSGGGDDHQIPQALSDWIACALGIEPGTWHVQNRGSRIEVYIGEDEGERLNVALAAAGLIV